MTRAQAQQMLVWSKDIANSNSHNEIQLSEIPPFTTAIIRDTVCGVSILFEDGSIVYLPKDGVSPEITGPNNEEILNPPADIEKEEYINLYSDIAKYIGDKCYTEDELSKSFPERYGYIV